MRIRLLLSCSFILVGFADCHFTSGQATYKMKACPTKEFAWPESSKTEKLGIYREPHKADSSNTYECRKLIRYHVKEKVEKTGVITKTEWIEYNNYVGLTGDKNCSLVISTTRVGPNVSESDYKDGLQKWGSSSENFVKLLFKNTSYSPEERPEKIELIGGKSEYADWCKKLPLPEVPSK
jgi:hypothetical protein